MAADRQDGVTDEEFFQDDDGDERVIVGCDDCGRLIRVPEDMEHEVNYCGECAPTTEDYDPADDLDRVEIGNESCDS